MIGCTHTHAIVVLLVTLGLLQDTAIVFEMETRDLIKNKIKYQRCYSPVIFMFLIKIWEPKFLISNTIMLFAYRCIKNVEYFIMSLLKKPLEAISLKKCIFNRILMLLPPKLQVIFLKKAFFTKIALNI